MSRYLIRGAHLLTMADGGETLDRGDLLIDGDRIADVAPSIDAPDAEQIDGRELIAMPGMIDTHRHMWAAMLRGGACYGDLHDYFVKVVFAHGAAFTPEDTYTSVRLGLAESVSSGITSLHAWEHNIQTPEHARAALQAMRESGLRGRFSYGPSSNPQDGSSFAQGSETIDLEDILKLRGEQFSEPGRIELGIACRGHEFSQEQIWKQEFAWAREHGLPITVHCMMTTGDLANGRAVSIYKDADALGPDMLLVHCIQVNADEIRWLAESRTPVSISILSELRCGMGIPPTLEMMNAGVPISLSLDTMAASDNSDMFNVMRITMGIERGRAGDGKVYQPMQVLRQATSEAAAILDFDRVGQLREGWRADVILLRADDLNMAPINVLDGQVVLAAQPSNVDTVFIDGVLRKQHGELIGLDPKELVRDATRAVEALKERVGVPFA